MDGDDDQPTQATQNVLDPRRVGKQNSGFSDDDIADIICVLHPHSKHARLEVRRAALQNCPHIYGRDEVNGDLYLEDDASRFDMGPPDFGNHVIVLKLSALAKDPRMGFTFGRNAARCDLCFTTDPLRRLSNIHFRIFVNEYNVVMLEDLSTNGTIIDGVLLKSRSQNTAETTRMLTSGARLKVLMHQVDMDLEFMVRIPRREGDLEAAYLKRLDDYFARVAALRAPPAADAPITPGPDGPPDLFGRPSGQPARRTALPDTRRGSATPTKSSVKRSIMPREWDGAGKYNRGSIIGKGAFAVVYQVTSKIDGSPYAAKELEKRHFMKNGIVDQKVENEMKIMQRIKHPNIVRYIENFDWEDRLLIIVMEFVHGGDLGKYINAQGPLSQPNVKVMATQLLDAFEYLHENSITHRDVKPDNILISSLEPLEVKLTDFGLSKMVDSEQTFLQTFCGTLLYCAPEVYTEFTEYDHAGRRNPRQRGRRTNNGQRYGHAVDVWSLGGVLFYALTGSPPYPVKSGISYSELLHRIMTTDLNVFPLEKVGVTADGLDFLRSMLQRRPELRATVQELRQHPWLGGPRLPIHSGYPESLDEITDDELQIEASQLSLDEAHTAAQVTRPDSDILIDDPMDNWSDISEKENNSQEKKADAPRLFGEVNVSAVGSSGAIPAHRLNLRVTSASDSMGETIILDSQAPDSFDDSDHFTPHRRSQPKGGVGASILSHNQSADQLQSVVHDLQSQSLGRTESLILGNTSMVSQSNGSRAVMHPSEFTASKRKPGYDTSDEFEYERAQDLRDRPTFKRLKSDLNMAAPTSSPLAEEVLEEYRLLASIPPIQRLESGRQIDRPVHKTIFWDRRDPKTHHVDYPEMTQLQLDVFRQAARDAGAKFEPGDSPFWALAMKYFPPTDWSALDNGKENEPPQAPRPRLLSRDARKLTNDDAYIPSTAPSAANPSDDEDFLPDTLPPEGQIVVPAKEDPEKKQIVALFESTPDSAVPNVHIPVSDPVLSYGRGAENMHVQGPRTEARVPKYAFKMLLYKEGFDASRDRNPQPWLRRDGTTDISEEEQARFAFYLCTKATNGVWVNDRHLLSHDAKKPLSPAHHWVKLHDGDELVIWRGAPSSDAGGRTKLTFRCFWGGSALPRGDSPAVSSPESEGRASAAGGKGRYKPIDSTLARKLDEIFPRAERRARADAAYSRSMAEAVREHALRERWVEIERQRSREFEETRAEAARIVAAQKGASRKGSPTSGNNNNGQVPVLAGRAGSGYCPA